MGAWATPDEMGEVPIDLTDAQMPGATRPGMAVACGVESLARSSG